MKIGTFLIWTLILGLFSFPLGTFSLEVYTWIDEKGGVHFTDSPEKIPPQYQDKYTCRELKDTGKTKNSSSFLPSEEPTGIPDKQKKGVGTTNSSLSEKDNFAEDSVSEDVLPEDLDLGKFDEEPLKEEKVTDKESEELPEG